MTAKLIDLEAQKAAPHILKQIELFLIDPPDSDFQRGFLAGLLCVYKEILGKDGSDARIKKAEAFI